MSDIESVLAASFAARTAAWAQWGEVDGDVLAHLINPFFMGCPRWPGLRESFRVVRRPGGVLVASDGLSDPFDTGEGPDDLNGFGLECYALTADPLATVAGSWLFDLVWQISQFAASRGDLAELLAEHELLTTELYNVGIPADHRSGFVNSEGRVGVLLGLTEQPIPAAIPGPLSRIRLVNAKLLTLEELNFAIDGKEEARHALAEAFREHRLASSVVRPSVSRR